VLRLPILLSVLCSLAACGPPPPLRAPLASTDQLGFWQRLTQLCGRSFPGRMVEGSDSVFVRNPLQLWVRECTPGEVRMTFIIGPDSSRSWVVTRTATALTLRHRVLRADGAEALVSGYGGVTLTPGSAGRQEFAADSATARLLPLAARNRWVLEIEPGRQLAYSLGRAGATRRFRLEFDLRRAQPGTRRAAETIPTPRP
jgi:hypothetical protein